MKKSLFLASALSALTLGTAMAEPLRLGMTPEPYMPYTSIDSSGKWIGLEADLSNAICAQIPDGCEIKQMAWDALIPSLGADKVDFIVGAFSVTDERRKVVDFSLPYQLPTSHVVGLKSDTTPVKSVAAEDGSGEVLSTEGLDAKYFGVQNSSTQSSYMTKYAPGLDTKSYDAADNAVADLLAGRLDYVVMGDGFIEDFLKSPEGQPYESKLLLPQNVLLGEGIAYAVRKGDAESLAKIDAPMKKMLESGEVAAILAKWND